LLLAAALLQPGCQGEIEDDDDAADDDTADDDDVADDDTAPDDDSADDDDDTSDPPPVDNDGDGSPEDEDCNDNNAAVHPGAEHACDGVMDNDCDAKLGRTATQTLTC